MENKPLQVNVWMDAKIYRRFSRFDGIEKEKKWRRPLVFACILCAFAAVCFILGASMGQGPLLGAVLTVVGLGLPLVYFGTFFSSVAKKIDRWGIKDKKRNAYRVTLTGAPDGIRVETPKKEPLSFRWQNAAGAYRLKEAIYLYVEPGKVYILPREQAGDQFEPIWELIGAMLPADKVKVYGRRSTSVTVSASPST